jgi:hypothetical protein
MAFATVLLFIVWSARSHKASIPDSVAPTLVCFSFAWAYLAMWRVARGCRKLGWNRSNYTQFLLAGLRPGDGDELVVWRWTFHLCYALLAVVLCVLAIVFTT